MPKSFIAVAGLVLATLSTPASATIVFSDNFDAENSGNTALNYTSFSNWASTGGGFVDLVATPDYGITCAGGSGSCVDLDGSPGPGEIETLSSFAFNTGDRLTFSFDFSGSQRGSVEGFGFGIRSQTGTILFNNPQIITACCGTASFGSGPGSSFFGTISGIPSDFPFSNVAMTFVAGSSGSIKLYLGSGSADNFGVLVDNVSLDISAAVPEPATWAMMIAGFGLVGGALRTANGRRRKILASPSIA